MNASAKNGEPSGPGFERGAECSPRWFFGRSAGVPLLPVCPSVSFRSHLLLDAAGGSKPIPGGVFSSARASVWGRGPKLGGGPR